MARMKPRERATSREIDAPTRHYGSKIDYSPIRQIELTPKPPRVKKGAANKTSKGRK